MIYLFIFFVAAVVVFFGLKSKGYYLYFKLKKDYYIGDECLEFEMQFPSGEKLYRIKTEYVMMIASERMRVIDEYLNQIAWLGIEIPTLQEGLRNMIRLTDEILLKPYEIESITARDDHHKIGHNLIDRTPKAFNASKENIDKMFLMFFVLSDENWREINPEMDKKKLALLDKYPEQRPFFFQKLSAVIEPLGLTYINVIQLATETLMLRQKVAEIIDELKYKD